MSKNLSSALGAPAAVLPTTNIAEHEVPILSANEVEEIFGENMFFEPMDDDHESHKENNPVITVPNTENKPVALPLTVNKNGDIGVFFNRIKSDANNVLVNFTPNISNCTVNFNFGSAN